MTTIRPATADDVPRIVEMAQRFYPTSGYGRIACMPDAQAAGLALVTMESGVMLVAEREGALIAMACLHIEPFIFNPAVVIAQEIVFWIEPEHRGGLLAVRILRAIDTACAARGATVVRMATLPASPPAAAQLYERSGYVASESYFVKVL